MASLGQIIFWCLMVSIFVTAGLLVFILSVSFSVKGSQVSQDIVDSSDKWPIGNLGEDVILSCRFRTSTSDMELTSRVSIIWNMEGRSEVVYEYDKGTVQLTGQDPRFKKRTLLFSDAIGSGNASLLLRNVNLRDSGVYQCSVTAPRGSGTAIVNLRVAAYSAPTLELMNTTLTAVAARWFPKPNVTWLNANDTVLNKSITSFFNDSIGINKLISSLQVTQLGNYTCIIQNQLVKAVSLATITDNETSSRTSFSFVAAVAPRVLL
uniref:Ig-like domain-containing protein n=2 Tax=Esox lucius TaxID=8010 RepID=A0A3P8ZJV7_ESOLU